MSACHYQGHPIPTHLLSKFSDFKGFPSVGHIKHASKIIEINSKIMLILSHLGTDSSASETGYSVQEKTAMFI